MADIYQMPNIENQKHFTKRLIKKELKKGDTWYLIAVDWFKQWKKYVNYCDTGATTGTHPGPVDNTPLFSQNGHLRPNVMNDLDYQFVPSECWELFLSWYGLVEGQLPIARRVIKEGVFVKSMKVEVYLMDLKLCMWGQDFDNISGSVIKQFSRLDTIDDVRKVMVTCFEISPERKVRLWQKFTSGNTSYEPLDQLSQTVQQAGLYQGQSIVIESQNTDGTWPKTGKPTPIASGRGQNDIESRKMIDLESSNNNNEMEVMIICGICLGILNSPRTLPCFHSFCESCLEQLKCSGTEDEGNQCLFCPTCREVFPIETDAKKDFRVERMIELHRKANAKRSLKCHKHPAHDIEAVCTVCKVEICSRCKFQDHDTHPSQTMESAVENLQPTMSDKIKTLSQLVDEMKIQQSAVEKKKCEIKWSKNKVMYELQKQKQILQQKLNAEYAQISRQIGSYFNEAEDKVVEQGNFLNCSVTLADAFIDRVTTGMDEVENVECYRLLQQSSAFCDEMVEKYRNKEFDVVAADVIVPKIVFTKAEIRQPLLGSVDRRV